MMQTATQNSPPSNERICHLNRETLPIPVKTLQSVVDADLIGDSSGMIRGIGISATADHLVCLRYAWQRRLLKHHSAFVLCERSDAIQYADTSDATFLIVDSLADGLFRLNHWLLSQNMLTPFVREEPSFGMHTGVHPTALVESGAWIGEGASVGPFSYVARDVVIEAGASVGPYSVIGEAPFVTVDRVATSAAGGTDEHILTRIPALGGVRICSGAALGSHVRVHKALFGETRIGYNAQIDSGAHIGHDVRIEKNVSLGADVRIGGHALLLANVTVGAAASIRDGIRIGCGAVVAPLSAVRKSVNDGVHVAGVPAREQLVWLKTQRNKSG